MIWVKSNVSKLSQDYRDGIGYGVYFASMKQVDLSWDSHALDKKAGCGIACLEPRGLEGEGYREDRKIPGICRPASAAQMPSSSFSRQNRSQRVRWREKSRRPLSRSCFHTYTQRNFSGKQRDPQILYLPSTSKLYTHSTSKYLQKFLHPDTAASCLFPL